MISSELTATCVPAGGAFFIFIQESYRSHAPTIFSLRPQIVSEIIPLPTNDNLYMKRSTPNPPKKKASARRRTPQEVEKEIHEARMKKISYLVEQKGKVEFTPPKTSSWNRMLSNHKPMEKVDASGKLDMQGNLGHVNRFFISTDEVVKIHQLFLRFAMPEKLYADLTWSYLNMVFAGTDALLGEQVRSNIDRSHKGLFTFFDFLYGLSDESVNIESASIAYTLTEQAKQGTKTNLQTLKTTGRLDTGFLTDILKLFQKVKAFPTLDAFYKVEKDQTRDQLDRNMGYKNAEKHAQSNYANALLDFLLRNVFETLGALVSNQEILKKETARLKRIYSDRKLCHFVGLLMLESGLLPAQYAEDDTTLIDLIKKKVGGRLAKRAAVRKEIIGKKRPAK